MKSTHVKTITILLIAISSNLGLVCQFNGVHFEKSTTWSQILQKAKNENKYIFVDCFTTWCGPCKYMSTQVFPLDSVGNFYNSHYINVGFQMDTTKNDPSEIKQQYSDAALVRSKYSVIAYPTYLFFNPDGELVHKSTGGNNSVEFIDLGKKSLEADYQLYTQLKKYDAGYTNKGFLKKLIQMLLSSTDILMASKVSKDYLKNFADLKNTGDLNFIFETTLSTVDTGFKIMLSNHKLFENALGKKTVNDKLTYLIFYNELEKNNAFSNWGQTNWKNFDHYLKRKYPFLSNKILLQSKLYKFRKNERWLDFTNTILAFHTKTPLTVAELNDYAWAIFMQCNDVNALNKALLLSKASFTNQEKIEPGYIDTYANILYKLGQKKEALIWEKKAQALAIEQGANKDWGQDVIDKILKGEKTW
jgi:thiol-disulfide isomerase/thioredoxin